MCLAALMVMATVLSSCNADQDHTLLGCNLATCSKLCNYREGAHCTDLGLCSCCPSAAKSENADKKAVTN
ncbi:hypothetical protein BRADI_1g78813v3 [Brachypodium distachyon]|uniref:Uncharacterized protein n=1 Tax=Brachypodium distachyon TaxID=15368 RepID=A0A0Q3HN55_BRADI|nr:hypothetical protein BRADI_1g78813v3 [Brachypodium distachyon]